MVSVLRYARNQTMLNLSEEVASQMVVSIGRLVKSSKKAVGKFQNKFSKTIDKLENSSYDASKMKYQLNY